MKKIILVATLAMAASAGASADTGYVGLAAGGTHGIFDCSGTVSCDKSDTGFKLFGGYKFTDNVALEAHYANYGKYRADVLASNTHVATDVELSGFGIGFALLGDLSPSWNGVVRAGLASNKAKVSASAGGFTFSEDDTTTNGYLGAGLGYKLTPNATLTGAIDYTQGKLDGEKVKATLYTIGVTFSF